MEPVGYAEDTEDVFLTRDCKELGRNKEIKKSLLQKHGSCQLGIEQDGHAALFTTALLMRTEICTFSL